MNVFVIGAGRIGHEIIETYVLNGHPVKAYDFSAESLEKGLANIKKDLDRKVKQGRITQEEATKAYSSITPIHDMKDGCDCDLAMEVIYENLEAKLKLFRELDEILPPETIIASNTSSISIMALAGATKRPDKVCGMHFFLPVPTSPVIELIRALTTSDETYNTIKELSESLGKTTITVNDAPGFVFNRIVIPYINEAIFTVYEGVASKEDVDQTLVLTLAHRLGPLSLADYIGLDVVYSIINYLYDEYQDSKYRCCPLLAQMVRAGKLGRKTGEGFFKYDK